MKAKKNNGQSFYPTRFRFKSSENKDTITSKAHLRSVSHHHSIQNKENLQLSIQTTSRLDRKPVSDFSKSRKKEHSINFPFAFVPSRRRTKTRLRRKAVFGSANFVDRSRTRLDNSKQRLVIQNKEVIVSKDRLRVAGLRRPIQNKTR